MTTLPEAGLGANLRFLMRELRHRGATFEVVDTREGLVLARLGSHEERLFDLDGFPTRYGDVVFAGNKHVAKALLARAGLAVPRGEIFGTEQIEQALIYAQELGFPLVVKPVHGIHGTNVFTQLDTLVEVQEALDRFITRQGGADTFLVEEHFRAREYRVFISQRGDCAVVHRDPAHVIGDGRSTLRRLVYVENDRRTLPRRTTAEGPIVLDALAEAFLSKQELTPEVVLESGRKVYLRGNSNLKTGGTCTDVTDDVHPSVFALAARVLAVFPGVTSLGIDLLTKDVTVEQRPEGYRILEVNTCPGIGMHMVPGRGSARDVAAAVADVLFPETAVGVPGTPRPLPACESKPLL